MLLVYLLKMIFGYNGNRIKQGKDYCVCQQFLCRAQTTTSFSGGAMLPSPRVFFYEIPLVNIQTPVR
jgi:hypothetical protein